MVKEGKDKDKVKQKKSSVADANNTQRPNQIVKKEDEEDDTKKKKTKIEQFTSSDSEYDSDSESDYHGVRITFSDSGFGKLILKAFAENIYSTFRFGKVVYGICYSA